MEPILCPICGAENSPDTTSCSICGEPFVEKTREIRDVKQKASPDKTERRPKPEEEAPTQLVRIACPHCQSEMLPGMTHCPACGKPVTVDKLMTIPPLYEEQKQDEKEKGPVKVRFKTPQPGSDQEQDEIPTQLFQPPQTVSESDESDQETRSPDRKRVEPEIHVSPRIFTYESMDLDDTRLLKEIPHVEPPHPPEEEARYRPAAPRKKEADSTDRAKGGTPPPLPLMVGGAFVVFIVTFALAYFATAPLFRKTTWELQFTRPPNPEIFESIPEHEKTSASRTDGVLDEQASTRDEIGGNATKIGYLTIPMTFPAHVWLDKAYLGLTPFVEFPVPAGSHLIEIQPAGWEPVRGRNYRQKYQIEIQEGESFSLPVKPLFTGKIYVSSLPWSRVYVDGKLKGTTPLVLYRIPAGSHEIMLKTIDNREYRTTVTVEPFAVVRIGTMFQSEQQD